MASKIRILITTGDVDGIGWEVTAKALSLIGPKSGVQFVYFRSPTSSRKWREKLSRRFRVVTVADLAEARAAKFLSSTVIEILSERAPADWVEESANACLTEDFQALVTGPLSKTGILASGRRDIGHTEILARVAKASPLFMGFVGEKFSVLLATGHKSLVRAVQELDTETIMRALDAAGRLRRISPTKKRRSPLAIVGVNPHAGEDGLIGHEENILHEAIKRAPRSLGKIEGPLVPDAAFLPQNWKRYSVYICPYHDQGLIPFKMVHGFDDGVHLTLGLPFVRTSVDHGTAKELFGRNRAKPGSMKKAILTAIQLCQENLK